MDDNVPVIKEMWETFLMSIALFLTGIAITIFDYVERGK